MNGDRVWPGISKKEVAQVCPPLPLLLFGPWSLSLNLLWLPYPLGFGGPGQGKAALCLHQWPGLLAWKGGSW